MLDNFNVIEVAVLAAYAYLIYEFAVDHDGEKAEPLTAGAVGVAAFFSLDSASASTDTFGGGAVNTSVVLGNWGFSELITIAALGYAAWRAYKTGRSTAMYVALAAAIYKLVLSNNSTSNF